MDINQLYYSYLSYVLEKEYPAAIDIANPYNYTTEVMNEIDFNQDSQKDVTFQVIFGGAKKIEGATSSVVTSFVMNAYAEMNTDGSYAKSLMDKLFKETSMEDIKVNGVTVFANLSSPVLVNPNYAHKSGYRAVYMMTGQIIASEEMLVGLEVQIDLKDGAGYRTVQIVSPNVTRKNNLQSQHTNLGVRTYSIGSDTSGSIAVILKNDDTSNELLKYLHGTLTTNLDLKLTPGGKDQIFTNLKVSEVSLGYDLQIRASVLNISFLKVAVS